MNFIQFEDNHLLCAYKKSGLLTQPSPTCCESLETELKSLIKKREQKPGLVYLDAIHRLDKKVSGLVLFAKTSKATSRLKKNMRNGNFIKKYRALTKKAPKELQGELIHFLKKEDFVSRVVEKGVDGAKKSLLRYSITPLNGCFVWEIELLTGRYHQIRCQLAAVSCPIIGDTKYEGKGPYRQEQIALEHYGIAFPHPISRKNMEINLDENLILKSYTIRGAQHLDLG